MGRRKGTGKGKGSGKGTGKGKGSGKGTKKEKKGTDAGNRQEEPMAPDAAGGGSNDAEASKSGIVGAGGRIGAASARSRKRDSEDVLSDRSVRQKSSSDEDGSTSSSSSISADQIASSPVAMESPPTAASPVAMESPPTAASPVASESPPTAETREMTQPLPTHDPSLTEDGLHIYHKPDPVDYVKPTRVKHRRPKSSKSKPQAYVAEESESSKSHGSYADAVASGGSTCSSGKASHQSGDKRPSAQRSHTNMSGSPSWEDRFCDDGGEKFVTDKSVADEFVKFLNSYIEPGEDNPYYPAQLKAMRARGNCFELTVHFEHILKSDKPLALNILKRSYLCRSCVAQFMIAEQFASEEEVVQKATVNMFDMPRSIQPLKDILKNKKSLLTWVEKILKLENVSVTVLTELAQALLTGFLAEIRYQHMKGKSWNGEYTIEDMALVDGCECRITKRPYDYSESGLTGEQQSQNSWVSVHASRKKKSLFDTARVGDVQRLEKIFTHALLNDKNGKEAEGAAVPLFYESLQTDMSQITAEDVKDEKFWQYILNHPCLKPPVVRLTLVTLLRTILCDNVQLWSLEVQELMDGELTNDWRIHANKSGILREIYNYEAEAEKKRLDDLKKQGVNVDVIKKRQQTTPFARTNSGLVIYNRHFLTHAKQIADVSDVSFLEIFFSSQFQYLPRLLKLLVKKDAFTGCFYEAWRSYSSYQVQFENDTKEKKTLSFW